MRVKSGPGLGTQGPRTKDSDAWAAEAGGLGPMAAQPHDTPSNKMKVSVPADVCLPAEH